MLEFQRLCASLKFLHSYGPCGGDFSLCRLIPFCTAFAYIICKTGSLRSIFLHEIGKKIEKSPVLCIPPGAARRHSHSRRPELPAARAPRRPEPPAARAATDERSPVAAARAPLPRLRRAGRMCGAVGRPAEISRCVFCQNQV